MFQNKPIRLHIFRRKTDTFFKGVLSEMEVYMTFFNIVEMKIMTSLLHTGIFYLASKEKNKPAQHKI